MRRPQQLAPAALVLVLAIAGFFSARDHARDDARRDSDHQAEVAAAEIRARVQHGMSLAESLRRLMVGFPDAGVDQDRFTRNAARWLSPAGVPAAAWVEEVPAARREAYERRTGHPVVALERTGGTVRAADRGAAYLPATLVSGIGPMAVPGLDLAREPGVAAALTRARTLYDTGATPLTVLRDGSDGVLLFKFAPRLTHGVVKPGFVVLFASELWLRAAATDEPSVRLAAGPPAADAEEPRGDEVARSFAEAGQRFEVAVPRVSAHGTGRVLPWVILAGGAVLAAAVTALRINARRRSEAQEELDRIFTLSPDLIVVADADGRFRRVNPAAEATLGYTRDELLSTPYLDLVHADDRDRTRAESRRLFAGNTTMSFENRFLRKDGGERVLEWTATPSLADHVLYAVGRDITDRRQAERALARLVDEQAALRRVATLVAEGVAPRILFEAVADEIRGQLGAQWTTIGRFEDDDTVELVASTSEQDVPVGTRLQLTEAIAMGEVHRTGRAAVRVHDDPGHGGVPAEVRELAGRLGIRCVLAVPIMVEGRLWGAAAAATAQERFPDDAIERTQGFTELAGTAIANAESRTELTASRARVVAASDKTRREIERDLHDGAQQRLVHTVVTLKLARKALRDGCEDAPQLISEALDQAERANVELRELVQGILPPVLTRGGLSAAVGAIAARMPVPVNVAVDVERLAPEVEATAYFVVAEALTNVVKHAGAERATVSARVAGGLLQVRVSDDGRGGARRRRGGGFVGLADRLAVLDGQLRVESPEDGGTVVAADIPLDGRAA